MPETFQIVLSIFGLIGIGYTCTRLGYVGSGVGEALSDFVYKVAVPVLLARTMASAEFSGFSPWAIWIAYFGGVVVVWVMAHVLIRRVFGRDNRAGVVAGLSTAFANTVLIAIPLVASVYGDEGLVYLLVIVAVHLPTMLAATLVLYEWGNIADGVVEAGSGARRPFADLAGSFFWRLGTNPIVLGIAVGGIIRVTGFEPAGALETIVNAIADTAGPVALLSVGMGLSQYGMARQLAPAMLMTVLKLAVMPGVVLGLALLLGLPPVVIAVAVLTAACPTGVTAFVIAGQFGTGQALASNTIAISTALGFATVAVWLLAMQALVS